jgi:MFS superfamily sulfate permease-like transporter
MNLQSFGPFNRFVDLRHDALSSVVEFLVALPLCIGITIASGAPTGSGIVTGIVAGLVVGWLSGSPLQSQRTCRRSYRGRL